MPDRDIDKWLEPMQIGGEWMNRDRQGQPISFFDWVERAEDQSYRLGRLGRV